MATGVIRLPDVRPVEVAHSVLIVERDEHFAVSDRDVAWHKGTLLSALANERGTMHVYGNESLTWAPIEGSVTVEASSPHQPHINPASTPKCCDAIGDGTNLRHANAKVLTDFHRATRANATVVDEDIKFLVDLLW